MNVGGTLKNKPVGKAACTSIMNLLSPILLPLGMCGAVECENGRIAIAVGGEAVRAVARRIEMTTWMAEPGTKRAEEALSRSTLSGTSTLRGVWTGRTHGADGEPGMAVQDAGGPVTWAMPRGGERGS